MYSAALFFKKFIICMIRYFVGNYSANILNYSAPFSLPYFKLFSSNFSLARGLGLARPCGPEVLENSLFFKMAENDVGDNLNLREMVHRKLRSVEQLLTQQTNNNLLDIPSLLETIERLI